MTSNLHPDTLAIHAGQAFDPRTGAVSFPIFQTSTFAQHAPGESRGYAYARGDNPTRRALEECLASIEGARYGVAFASGLAAVNAVISTLSEGDHVIAGRDLYGGSYRLFTKVFAKFGVRFSFVDTASVAAIEGAIEPATKLLWLETPSNPLLTVTDIQASVAVAKARSKGIRVLVDNTFATPITQRPLELGADLVLHSTTKYLNGHGDVIGGAILTNDESIDREIRFLQNAIGGVPGPQDSYLILRGLKTLSLRVERHCQSALKVARFLAADARVKKVYYPGLESHPGHEIAARQQTAFGGIVSFDLGSREEANAFCKTTQLFALAESLGAPRSLVCHPPTMTHASVEPEVRKDRGIGDGLVRLSVGLEDVRDLIADIDQALGSAAAVSAVAGAEVAAA